ncbi:MAG: sugar phosphate isomerase/epimerase [Opitutaceae bacterium]|jgi:sugar phosphate isomerase/epimerase|nr:sugar phosphate isomerase/epimerase [Opitutaceae bacterium]
MRTGLVSVTFRRLKSGQILRLMGRAGLTCVEWGGDTHVPPGDVDAARRVRRETVDAGVEIISYGSYYGLDASGQEGLAFERVLETAVELNAPVIRVWAGRRTKLATHPDHYSKAVADALRIAEMAKRAGRKIAFEYHAGTFTDAVAGAAKFMEATKHPAICSLWQPPNGQTFEYCAESLRGVLPFLHHAHVFHWWPDETCRLPLEMGASRWVRYLEIIQAGCPQLDLLLEFVAHDSPGQLIADAACLRHWVECVQKK